MNFRSSLSFILVLGLAGLLLSACGGGDDGGGDPQPQACSITVTSPATATIFQPGNDDQDDCTIRWSSTGSPSAVDITLVKGGVDVGPIAIGVANSGVYFWTAENLGANNGSDFSIRVSASDDDACFGESGQITLINTSGCYFNFTNDWRDEYNAGETLNLTWTSGNTTGSVDIELHTLVGGFLAGIAEGVTDDGSYDWHVDSYHFSTNYGFYQIMVVDHQVESCYAVSDTFSIYDPDICSITVVDPAEGVSWDEGDQHTINLTVSDDVSTVDLRLYVGSIFVNHIALDVDVTSSPSFTWTVNDWDQNIAGDSTYRIRAYNSEDGYCVGISDMFTIVPLP